MSASLVGSEMCIRDSSGLQRCTIFAAAHRSLADRSRGSGTSRARTPPVSYTHLTLPTICSV
eukprot:2199876-Alexandrium_andersonii.AAC.1